MGANIKEWFEQIRYKWQNLSSLMKKVAILGIISLLVIIGTFSYMMNKVEYGVLFSNLAQADAGKVTTDLKEKNIPYKLGDNGTTILIDKNMIDEYRIDLAVENKLPDSTTGFELFDQSDMMTTDEDRKIMYQRALTGELEQAIGSLDGVQKVKVILVTPDDGVFSREKKDATASIVLTLNGNLSDSSIQGIVTLASGAVENLSPENVKVVDANGKVLAGGEEAESLANVSDRYIGIKSAYEEALEKKVRNLLEPIYGADKLKVSINVDLDFDSVERTTTTYNNPEIRSEQVEASGNADAIQEAQTGQVNDNVTVVTGDDAEGNRNYRRSVNNELDTETTKTISAPGMIRRMTSSVVVPGNLPADVQQELRTLIASAVGFNEERGDEIAVQGLDFETAEDDGATDDMIEQEAKNANWWIYLAIAGGILLTIVIVTIIILIVRRRRNDDDFLVAEEEMQESVASPALDEELLQSIARNQATTAYEEAEDDNEIDTIDPAENEKRKEAEKYDERDRRAKQFANDNPEIAAELIKAWLKEK
ncbi:flagellar M-ring protein FliF [Enterococcus saccharolyticus]|uniref:flagellar basal-body MS-ring/collar protein FliF n=1 Tax=Enterococcus saccharolyticus TaxID=41997 RepID=UPI001E2D36E2|nr:flagellar basal-body MS-ring/collar protein FliF [Enterococcus saccharolyticus]MCD5002886.1 flagellar M-ring protein FliF [Enterococcus saccharolyticus]